jgi:hypothetical protein
MYPSSGQDSSVGILTCYGLDGPGIKSWVGRDFRRLSRPAQGAPSLLYNGYRFHPGGKAATAWCWTSFRIWCWGYRKSRLCVCVAWGVCMCGCFDNCVGVLVMCVLVFTVFLYCFIYVYYLFCLYWCEDYCHQVTTQLQWSWWWWWGWCWWQWWWWWW